MRSRILQIFLLSLILVSCDKYDLEIDPEFRTTINYYRLNDTIFFQSEQNLMEYDTIRISGIDSIRQYPTISDVHPMKRISLRIEHLPSDNWKEPRIIGREVENQPMITVSNSFENCCQVRLKYREFESPIPQKISDEINNKIDTLMRQSPIKIKNDFITELYWSNKEGIKGYRKHNGQVYWRKTHHNNGYK